MLWGPADALRDAQEASRVLRLRANVSHSAVVSELCDVYPLDRHVGSGAYRAHHLVASGDLAPGLRLFLCCWVGEMYSLILTRMNSVDPVIVGEEWIDVCGLMENLRSVTILDEETARRRAS
jgi:hypothetical protein